MDYQYSDFNGADVYFDSHLGESLWSEIEFEVLRLPLCLQASDQSGRVGMPIFDPKETNAQLTAATAEHGWAAVPVPDELTMFGVDWDGGKSSVLAEWQFSNYPFLWNNVIRSEAVYRAGTELPSTGRTEALIVVTKSGILPASNSTLYFEQAHEQLSAVTDFGAFTIPIRLVGLFPPPGGEIEALWTVYPGRYSRVGNSSEMRIFRQTISTRSSKYGHRGASYVLLD